ncbi:sugar-binding transcriptional regulator [Paramicrobacterium chengjingii]|uniref:Sugar-binding domain-containing protein n=1 Tax=Paramicrobacterium chengjingii TaxID=2769067 RepID=A0ABX6YHG6_9MICO|nr:sugar-binding domain-containing protein [Microbacterium chengjingii]QPZ38202.1 hypothetical protein HCR76_15665 [Microbacterium chengjingii]
MSAPERRGKTSLGRADAVLYAARRFYIDGIARAVISEELGISRFRVGGLLSEARDGGYVSISLMRPDGLDADRSRALVERTSVERAIVCPPLVEGDLSTVLAGAAGGYLTENLGPADILGLSSGRTTHMIGRSTQRLACTAIVQTTGVVRVDTLTESPVETIRRLAQLSGATSYPMYAPGLLPTAELTQQINDEPGIARTVAMFPSITTLVASIATWGEKTSAFYDACNKATLAELREANPSAELIGTLLTADGEVVGQEFTRRCVAMQTDLLRAVPDVVGIGGGEHQHAAVLAAVRSGIVNTLVTDAATADFVLANV